MGSPYRTLRYREARKAYAEALELVASETSTLFFNLATAQTNLDIAAYNYASADTLYRYAEGRYNIGTITENEMLQLEINKLTEETNMMNARIEVEDQMQTLRSFLGINREINYESFRKTAFLNSKSLYKKHYNWHSKTVPILTLINANN